MSAEQDTREALTEAVNDAKLLVRDYTGYGIKKLDAAIDRIANIGRAALQAREAPQPVAWRTEAAAWLRRKDAEGNTGWGNPGHWASVFAQQLEAEQEAAPFGYEPWEAPNKFGDRPTELGKALGRNLAQFTALAGEATREAPPAPEPLTDFQLDTLFSLAHEHGEFGRGFREAVRAALTSNKGEGQ
jgi:hypothetical protein